MATHKLITFKSHFNFIYELVPADLVQRTMMKVCSFMTFIWVLLCDFILRSFRHLIKHFAGTRLDDDHVLFVEQEDRVVRSSSVSNCLIFDESGEDEKSEFTFGFQFQIKDEDLISDGGTHDVKLEKTGDAFMDDGLKTMMNTSKYQFVSVQDFGGFVAEPKSASFTVHELFVEPHSIEDDFIIKEKEIIENLGEVNVQHHAETKDEQKEFDEASNLSSSGEDDDFMETEVSSSQILQSVDISATDSLISEEKSKESVTNDSICDEIQDLQEKSELNLGKNGDLKNEQFNWLGDFFIRNESFCYGFDSSQESEFNSVDHHHLESDDSITERELESFSPSVPEEIDDNHIDPEFKDEHVSDSCELENTMEPEHELIKETKFEEETDVQQSWEFDSDDEEEDGNYDDDDDDILLEHQELIGQMKMELKNTRTGGLPTILEEVETPKMKENYKPLKINEKLEHRDQMAEIQKFYKSYTEKMRKLDVLNYQTLQAINFLRMKNPEQLNTGENTSLSAIKSIIYPNLWPCKLRRIYADPTLKSITELHKDLEIVYVGQTCLSWEILHWQYKKAKELQLYDPQGYRSYNQIAIEFQQFHVLLKRFHEDELFQGPRVQNYTKQRCNLRGFLQIPAIKDDNLKEKKSRKKEQDAVSISTMTKIIKESMTVFWEFLQTDKDTTNLFLTIILQGSKANLQDPADSDLFIKIKTIHQKKEKWLKDILRTGNCIVKKFQKQQETILDQHMFVSQVELRLISRVLNLPRLTKDQLLWCYSKLNNIIFVDRKVQVEDSLFLIFPC